MPQLSIALNGSRLRDLQLYGGDDQSIDVIVYGKDGDRTPIAVSDLSVAYGPWGNQGTLPVNGDTFAAYFGWRSGYRMTGTVYGRRTTLAYGIITAPDYVDSYCGFSDYGWWIWGAQPVITPNASFILALDDGVLALDGATLYLES